MCKAWSEGQCNDPLCKFAHYEDELRSTDMFFKKTLCIWNEKGKCRNGSQCRFAHGLTELRAHVQKNQEEVAPMQGLARKYDLFKSVPPSAAEPMKVQPMVAPLATGSPEFDAQMPILPTLPMADGQLPEMPIMPPLGLGDAQLPEMPILPALSMIDPNLPEAVLAPMVADALSATRSQLHEMQAMTEAAQDTSMNLDLQRLCQNISMLSMQCSQIQMSLQAQYAEKELAATHSLPDNDVLAEMYTAMMTGKDVPYVPTFPDFAAYANIDTCTGLGTDMGTLGDDSGLSANVGLVGPQELDWMSMQCDAAMGA